MCKLTINLAASKFVFTHKSKDKERPWQLYTKKSTKTGVNIFCLCRRGDIDSETRVELKIYGVRPPQRVVLITGTEKD